MIDALRQVQVLSGEGRFGDAVQLCRRIVADDPGCVSGWVLLGAALLRLGDPDGSREASARAVALDGQVALAHCNLGAAHAERLELADALACYERALAIDPDHALTHTNRALAWLLQGDYARGFPEYEWRWRLSDVFRRPVPHPELQWHGEDLRGGTLLLYAEQGSGDVLQMIRFVPEVRARGVRCVVHCGQPLARLLRHSALADEISINDEIDLPAFDRHASLMSVPALLGTSIERIPAQVPYVRPDNRVLERWRARLPGGSILRVGLCWRGNAHHRRDAQRSIHPALLGVLAGMPGVRWVSLQKGHGAATDLPFETLDLSPLLHDFADTAAAILQLDLVITVDTSVAHLAGALGRPVWVLLPFAPDWRWLLDRHDSPWYPTARLFRQPARGDWVHVIAQVGEALADIRARQQGDGARKNVEGAKAEGR